MSDEADNTKRLSEAETKLDALDRTDMERLIAGHDAGLNELMERHAAKLFNYLIRCLQNEEDAADATQESFVRVYQNRTRFHVSERFSTWLYAIATNLIKDRYRYRSRHPQVSLDAENEVTGGSLRNNLPEEGPSPREALDARERSEKVRRAVAALPEELRTPLVLAEYEELSHVEIAAILKCSAKAVEMRVYRARQHLRTALSSLLEITE